MAKRRHCRGRKWNPSRISIVSLHFVLVIPQFTILENVEREMWSHSFSRDRIITALSVRRLAQWRGEKGGKCFQRQGREMSREPLWVLLRASPCNFLVIQTFLWTFLHPLLPSASIFPWTWSSFPFFFLNVRGLFFWNRMKLCLMTVYVSVPRRSVWCGMERKRHVFGKSHIFALPSFAFPVKMCVLGP